MIPVVFNGCFGWLHPASGATGVVMCNAYGHEALLAHRGWRGIAEHLASTGTPTLRFDYRGTGDSLESESDGDRVAAWIQSIKDAVHYLRAQPGIKRVVLCGVRLGAMLAAVAASESDGIDGLILLAPLFTGREYLRELKLTQRQWRNSAAGHIAAETNTEGYVEALGFRLSPETAERIGALNLLSGKAPKVPRVLVMDSLNVAGVQRLRDYYVAAGVAVEIHDFPDYTRLIGESNYTRAPLLTFDALTSWLNESEPVGEDALVLAASVTTPTSLSSYEASPYATAVLMGDGFIETACNFGDQGLFGIYCQPGPLSIDRASDTDTPSLRTSIAALDRDVARHGVLFVNTAASHHVGEARMWVEEGRRLARQGVASLRMDVGLLGDSAHAASSVSDGDQHADQSCVDVSMGIDFLVSKGHSIPSAVGICSGAYLVMKAAAQNAALRGALLINQREYALTPALVQRQSRQAFVAPSSVYMRSLKSLEKWERLLSGKIPVATIARELIQRRMQHARRTTTYLIDTLIGRESVRASVRKDFKKLERQGVKVDIKYGDLDIGLEETRLFFGKDFHWLRGLRNVRATIDTTIDHALFLYPARALLTQWIDEQLLALAVQPKKQGKAVRDDGRTHSKANANANANANSNLNANEKVAVKTSRSVSDPLEP